MLIFISYKLQKSSDSQQQLVRFFIFYLFIYSLHPPPLFFSFPSIPHELFFCIETRDCCCNNLCSWCWPGLNEKKRTERIDAPKTGSLYNNGGASFISTSIQHFRSSSSSFIVRGRRQLGRKQPKNNREKENKNNNEIKKTLEKRPAADALELYGPAKGRT